MLAPWKKSYDKPRQCIKKQRYYFAKINFGPYSQNYGLSSSHVQMWELDHKEGWVPKNWCLKLRSWRRLLRVPWIARKSNQSVLKEISPEYSLEGLMLKLKLQYFGHLMWRVSSLEKTLMLGKIEGRTKEKGATEGEMVRWHNWPNGHEFEQSQGDSEGQGSLACCSPWGHKYWGMIRTEQQQMLVSQNNWEVFLPLQFWNTNCS